MPDRLRALRTEVGRIYRRFDLLNLTVSTIFKNSLAGNKSLSFNQKGYYTYE